MPEPLLAGDGTGGDAAASSSSSAQSLLAALVPAASSTAGCRLQPQPPPAGEAPGHAALLRARTGGGDALLRPADASRRDWPPKLARLTEAVSRPTAAVGAAMLGGVVAALADDAAAARGASSSGDDAAVTELEPPPRLASAAAVSAGGGGVGSTCAALSPAIARLLLPLGADGAGDEGQQLLQLLLSERDRRVLAVAVDRLTAGVEGGDSTTAAAAAAPELPAPAPAVLAVGKRPGKRTAAAAAHEPAGGTDGDSANGWLAALLQGGVSDGDDAGGRCIPPQPLAALLLDGVVGVSGDASADAAAAATVTELDVPALLQPALSAASAGCLPASVPPLPLTPPGGELPPPPPSHSQLAAWARLGGAATGAGSMGAPPSVTPLPAAVAATGHLRAWAPVNGGDGGWGGGAAPSGASPAGPTATVNAAGDDASRFPTLPPLLLGGGGGLPSLLGAAAAAATAQASAVSVGSGGGGGTTAATSRLFAAAAAGAVAAALGRALAAAVAPPPVADANEAANGSSPQRAPQQQTAAPPSKRKREPLSSPPSATPSPDRKHARPDGFDVEMGEAAAGAAGGDIGGSGAASANTDEPAWVAFARRRAAELSGELADAGVELPTPPAPNDGGDAAAASTGWSLPHPDALRPAVEALTHRAAAAAAAAKSAGSSTSSAAAVASSRRALACCVLLHTLAWLPLKPDAASRAEYVARLAGNRAYASRLAAGGCGGDLPELARLLAAAGDEAVATEPPPPSSEQMAVEAPSSPPPGEGSDGGDDAALPTPRFTLRPHTALSLQLRSPAAGGRFAPTVRKAASPVADDEPEPRQQEDGEAEQQPMQHASSLSPAAPGPPPEAEVVLRVPVSSDGSSSSLLQDVPLLRALEAPASVTVAAPGGGGLITVPRFRFGLVERLPLPPPVDLLLDEATAVCLPALVGDLMEPGEYYGGGGGSGGASSSSSAAAPYFSERLKGFTRALTEQARRYARLVVVVRLPAPPVGAAAAGDGGSSTVTSAGAAGLPQGAVRVLQALHVSGLNFPVPLTWRLAAGPGAVAACLRGLAAGAVLPRLLAPAAGDDHEGDASARLRALAHAAARPWLAGDDGSEAGGVSVAGLEAFLVGGGLNPLLAARVAAACGGAGGRAVAALAAVARGGGGGGAEALQQHLLGGGGGAALAALLAPAAAAVTWGAAAAAE